jgi:hypothetical protein
VPSATERPSLQCSSSRAAGNRTGRFTFLPGARLARDRLLARQLPHRLESLVRFDDPLDLRNEVAGRDGEEDGVGPHPLVLGRRQRDPLDAVVVTALAEELNKLGAGLLAQVADPLVDVAEERLVSGDPIGSRVARRYPSSFSTTWK